MGEISFQNLSVLVVQDRVFMNAVLQSCLEALGFKAIHTATDGETGFHTFQREHPDLVITDWDVDPVDGIAFMNKIRRSSDSVNRIVPIIMLTGYCSMNRVRMAANAGVNHYITKPFTVEKLVDGFAQIINFPCDYVESEEYCGPDRRTKKRK